MDEKNKSDVKTDTPTPEATKSINETKPETKAAAPEAKTETPKPATGVTSEKPAETKPATNVTKLDNPAATSKADTSAAQATERPAAPIVATTPETDDAAASKRPLLAFIAGLLTAFIAWQLYSVIMDNRTTDDSFPNPIATIDGTPVDQKLFEQNVNQSLDAAALQGLDTTDPIVRETVAEQALEVIINTRLLVGAAEAAGYTVTDEEVTSRIEELEAQFGSSEALDEELNRLGLDRASLLVDVREQLVVDAFLTEDVVAEETPVTDTDIEELHGQLASTNPNFPPLDEVRDALEAQLIQQNQQVTIEAYLETLRSERDIKINL